MVPSRSRFFPLGFFKNKHHTHVESIIIFYRKFSAQFDEEWGSNNFREKQKCAKAIYFIRCMLFKMSCILNTHSTHSGTRWTVGISSRGYEFVPVCVLRQIEAPFVINNVDSRVKGKRSRMGKKSLEVTICAFSASFLVLRKMKECNSFIHETERNERQDDCNYLEGLRITDLAQAHLMAAEGKGGCTVCVSLLVLLIDGNHLSQLSLSFQSQVRMDRPKNKIVKS